MSRTAVKYGARSRKGWWLASLPLGDNGKKMRNREVK